MCIAERACPHTIMVNRKGQRFANEAANYNDLGKAFGHFNENGTGFRNLPAHAHSRFSIQGKIQPVDRFAGRSGPPSGLSRLTPWKAWAEKIGVDKDGLLETVARFNGFVLEGKDRDFGRGDSAYDRYVGDTSVPHPNLGTIEKAPFYAAPMYPGALGTKGGPKTNEDAQVLDVRGEVIDGLYAAGNAMAGGLRPQLLWWRHLHRTGCNLRLLGRHSRGKTGKKPFISRESQIR